MNDRATIGRMAALSCLVCGLLLAGQAFSQSVPPPPPQAENQTPPAAAALRVTTRSVQVSVIALDKDGHPVTGLTKDDFSLTDQGQEQKITYFAEETANREATMTTSISTANAFSNRLDQKAGSPNSATVILLDLRNTSFADMAFAKKQIAKFLSQIQPQDRVALYSLSSKVYILHDFTQDASALLRALADTANSYDFRLGASEVGNARESLGSAADASTMPATEYDTTNRVEQTAHAIKAIADHLRGLPGRKNLIWISSSFPIQILTSGGDTSQAATRAAGNSATFTDQIEDAARSLNSADVAVYPVDARGLIGNPQAFLRGGLQDDIRNRAPDTTSSFPDRANFDTMNTFAEHTGGLAFYNTNDIQGAVRKAIDDARVTYVLGYDPINTKWDGKFRELKIRTDKPGVHLRYRLGYYALPDAAPTEIQKAQLLKDAEWSPIEATDLGIEVTADPVETPEGRGIHAQLRIASNQLHFELSENHWKDSLDVAWVEIGPNGKAIGALKKTVGLDVPQESFDVLVSRGVSFDQTFRPSANAVELRLVVRDGGSGAIGSVNIPLTQIFGDTKTSIATNQTPPAAPADKTLRVTTRAVQVSVLAQDGQGKPIQGLTREDFTVLDNGVAQKIVSFSQHSSRLTADVTPGVRPVSANTFSNRVDETTGVPPSVTVILLDALNTDFQDMASARAQVVKFLRQLHPEDRVALYELTTKLIVLHDFTSDTATLLRALGAAPNPQSGAPDAPPQITAAMEAKLLAGGKGTPPAGDPGWLTAELEKEEVFDQINKVDGTTDAITQIAQHLARLPGRKNLVWVSESFPFWVEMDPTRPSRINASAQALSDANVAIYPIDARALVAQTLDQPGIFFSKHKPAAPPAGTLDTMQMLALGTGGLSFFNTNDLGGAIRRAIDDSSLTYELTYYPTNEKWDGKFRDIKVEVKRSGAHLRYRKGYFATPATPTTPESRAQLLATAAQSPLEATELGLNVEISAVDVPGPRQVKGEVRVDPDQMRFDLNAGQWTDDVEVVWIELDAAGEDIGHSGKDLTLSYSDEMHEKIKRDGLVFDETVVLADGVVELRLVARDSGTGSIGSVNIPLTRILEKMSRPATPKN